MYLVQVVHGFCRWSGTDIPGKMSLDSLDVSQRRPLCGREKSGRFYPNQQFLHLSLTLNSSGLRGPAYIVLNQLFKSFTNQRL